MAKKLSAELVAQVRLQNFARACKRAPKDFTLLLIGVLGLYILGQSWHWHRWGIFGTVLAKLVADVDSSGTMLEPSFAKFEAIERPSTIMTMQR